MDKNKDFIVVEGVELFAPKEMLDKLKAYNPHYFNPLPKDWEDVIQSDLPSWNNHNGPAINPWQNINAWHSESAASFVNEKTATSRLAGAKSRSSLAPCLRASAAMPAANAK